MKAELEATANKILGFLSQDPTNLQLLATLVDTKMKLGDFPIARQYAEQALTLVPSEPHFLFRMSNIALAEGRFEDAVRILQSLRDGGVHSPAIEQNLAHALLFLKRYSEARDLLIPIIGNVDAPEATMLLLRAHHYLGELDEAIVLAIRHLEKHSNDSKVMGVLSTLYLDNNDAQNAVLWANRATELDPDSAETLITMGTLAVGQENTAAARDALERALKVDPRNGRGWTGLGMADMLALDLPKARDDFIEAAKHMPNHIGTWHALAWCQMMMGDLAGSKESFNQSMEIDRSFAETHGGLASIAAMEGKTEEAKRLIETALRLDANAYSPKLAQIVLLQAAGKPDVATRIIQTTLKSQAAPGGEGTLMDMLGRVISKAGSSNKS
jgi:tetratricopeptide (TPR) repeat protein